MSEDAQRYELQFEITVDDVVDFLRLDQRTLNAAGAIGGVALVAVGIVFIFLAGDVLFGLLSILLGAGWVALAQTTYFDRWRSSRQAKEIIGHTIRLSIGDAGIGVSANGKRTPVEWASATGVKDDERIVIVARNRQPGLWIPARAFASADQRAAVIDYMRAHISETRAQREMAKRR
jgi:hypothetical protein